ncbi:MAG: AraC family transcriptional regulator [Clostridia bacterium]|nr:AraC family transcriptional regulator [Clostridia bacterium]
MILVGLHEKEIFSENYPFRLEANTSGDFRYPLHWHNAVELIYVSEGCSRITVNGVEYLLENTEILVIPSGEIHDIHSIGKQFFIQFDISMLDGFGGIHNIKPFLTQAKKISTKDDKYLHKAIENKIFEMVHEYEKKEFAYALSLNARVYDILVLLSRSLVEKISFESLNNSSKRVFGLEKINSAFKYIEEHYQDEITLKDISSAVGFSEYHFSRLFKEITEKNFHHYLNEFRIKKAEKLLMNSSLTIAQIAHEVGFNSFVTFNRMFKKVKGCSPTFYKKAGV